MPIAKFQLPDGRVARFEVPDGTTPEQAERLMSQYFAAPQQEAPPAKTPGVVESGIAGLKKLLSSQRTALESPFGAEEAAQRGLARSRELEAKTPSQLSLEAVKKKYAEEGVLPAAGEVLRQAPHFIAEQAPQLGEMIAGGRLGAMAGSPFGPVGSVIGGTAGAVAPLFTQAYGAGAERRAAEGLEQDPTKTAVSAAGQAGVEYVATLLPFGKQLLGRMLGFGEKEAATALVNPAARAMAEESLKKTLAKGATVGAVAEIPAEVTQQMLDRWQANLPLLSDDALKEYQEAAYGAGLFGAPLGGVGRVAQRGEARRQVAAADAVEAAERARTEQEKEAAAKGSPEYKLGIADRHDALKAQLAQMQTQLKENKPGKEAAEGQQDAYAGLKRRYQELVEEFKPVKKEYDEIKGEVRALRTSMMPTMPEEAPAAPAAEPQVLPNVQQKMDQYKELQATAEPLETQMQEAAAKGDTEAINALVPRYKSMQEQLAQLKTEIESLGGTTLTPELFEKDVAKQTKDMDAQIAAAQKKLTKASDEGDFDALPGLATKLDELRAQKAKLDEDFAAQREKLQVNQIPVGETIPLIKPEEMPAQEPSVKPTEAAAGPLPAAKEVKPGVEFDLFSDYNILNTAINNRDERTLETLRRAREAADKKAFETAQSKLTPREQVADLLDNQVGKIVRRERNYDVREVKTGPNAGQEIYVSDDVAAEIARLRNLVEKPIGNAKRSLLQQAHDEYARIEQLENQLETGIAAPLTAEKVEALKAKFGKAEVPAERQMNAGEIYQAKRSLEAAKKKYELTLGRIKKVRDQVEAELAKLYNVTEVKTKRQKAAETEALGRSERQMSREAKLAKRISEGDVRKEAEASEKLRELAKEIGFDEDEYQAKALQMQKRLQNLQNKYGKDDPKVREYFDKASAELTDFAIKLGKKSPEYKAVLKEQVAQYREALSQSKQEIKSKRSTQETRKLPKLGTMKTGTPESMERSKKADEGFRRKMTDKERAKMEQDFKEGAAFRTAKTGEAVVDPTEAKGRIVEIKSRLPKGVNLVYEPTLEGMKPETLAMLKAEGYKEGTKFKGVVLPDGTIVVVGDAHTDMTDLEETLFHEMVGHYGIDTVIGLNRLKEFAHATDLEKLAKKLGGDAMWRDAVDAMTFAVEQKGDPDLAALREIIAYTAQQRITESFKEKAGRWLQQLVGMVRAGLRAMGFKNFSEMSTSDVFYAIKRADKAFNDRTIGPYRAADGKMSFRTKKEQTPFGKSFVATEPSIKDKLLGNFMGLSGRVQFVDQYAALDAAMKKGLSQGVISDLEAEQAAYYLRFGQQANQFATQALTNGPLTLTSETTARGKEFIYKAKPGANMVEVAKALEKSGIKNSTQLEAMFTAYMAGKRAKQVGWNKLNIANPALAEQEYNDIMAELRGNDKARTAFEEAAKIYKEYNNGLIDFLVQTGYMSKQKAAELKAIDYVPYYRVQGGELQLLVDKERPIRIANIKDEPMLHELVGDNQQILPIFTSSAQNAFILTRMGLRNQMMKDNAMLLARMGIASRIGKGSGPQGTNTVRYKVGGEDNFAVIDTDMYGVPAELIVKGMEGIKTTLPLAIKLMGMPANVLRQFVTRNPAYAIRQVIRDPLTAWFTTGTDGVPVLNSFKELATMVAGRSEAERKLMEAGAISSNVMTGGQEDVAKAMRDMSMGKSGWTKLMAKADALAMQGDAATRAVVYKDSIGKGMSEMQALMRTLESMNFSRRGLSPTIQMLSTVIPFFNAQIQGLDVLYRAFTGKMPYSEQLKIRQKLYTRGLLLAAGTLAYAAAMEDDEAYKRAKPEERLGNWFVYTPFSDEPMRVPIPFELGYLFKALPEAVFNMGAEDERSADVTKGMGKLVALSNPFSLPQAIKPLTEVVLGKSFFGGDIESMREKTQMLPGERYRESTTEVAKMLGSVTGDAGLTPIKIDHLIRGYTGGLGIAIASLANPLLNTEAQAVEKPTMKTSKLPFIGGLFQPVEGRGTLDAAYERMLEIQQAQGTFKALAESGKREEAKAFLEQYRNKVAAASLSGTVQQQLGELAKAKRQVLASPRSTAEKDELITKLDKAQYELAKRFLAVTGETRPQ